RNHPEGRVILENLTRSARHRNVSTQAGVPAIDAPLEVGRALAAQHAARSEHRPVQPTVPSLEDLTRGVVEDPVRLARGRSVTRALEPNIATIELVEVFHDVQRRADLRSTPVGESVDLHRRGPPTH